MFGFKKTQKLTARAYDRGLFEAIECGRITPTEDVRDWYEGVKAGRLSLAF